MAEYVGIDYGMGISNRDPENPELHYGAISQHTPAGWIWDDFEGDYGDAQLECENCGTEFSDDTVGAGDTVECPNCEEDVEVGDDSWSEDAIEQVYKAKDGYEIQYSESLCCFIVTKSPFYTHAIYCSPCLPGSGDLDSPNENGIKTYCLGPDFFDSDNPCPYPIYKIETDELVYTPEAE